MRSPTTAFRHLVLAALLMVTALPAAAEEIRTVTADIPATGLVRLENLAGKALLKPASGDHLRVRAKIHAEGASARETEELLEGMEIVEERGRWVLTYPVERHSTFAYPGGGWGGSTRTDYRGDRVKVKGRSWGSAPVLYADLVVEIPPGARFALRNVVGDVAGEDLVGEIEVDTGSGDIWLKDVEGELVADTGSGDVTLRNVRGRRLVADTGSGEVRAEEVDVERLVADTGSGSVWIGTLRARDVEADTGSGDITLEDVELEDLVADTGSGDVLVTGDLSGARRIVADTGSGDVTILAGSDFQFDLEADLGSGRVRVGYRDADLVRDGREIVGAHRGTQGTRISVDTGSGDCEVAPRKG
ncbi:MAG: DUF4097 family beta strand repeat-containing protein [Thermoanaerobaculia bacterium]|nr:DUF4097 family beta strand repeat-containing protein [Thermoanaerobaculia bacterium]